MRDALVRLDRLEAGPFTTSGPVRITGDDSRRGPQLLGGVGEIAVNQPTLGLHDLPGDDDRVDVLGSLTLLPTSFIQELG